MSEEVKQEVKQETEVAEQPATDVENAAPAAEEAAPAATDAEATAAPEESNGAKPENGSSEPSKYAENENYQKLIGLKMKQPVAEVICEIYDSGLLTPEDLDERAVDIINSVSVDQAKFIFSEIQKSELFGVTTKSLYVTSLIRSFKDRCRHQGAAAVTSGKLIQGPELEVMKKLLEETGYPLEVTIGQRKVGGPPPEWDGPATGPTGSCEIYVGHIPNDIFEDKLLPLFAESGKVYDLRLMMDPMTGASRGYAFVTYCNKEDAAAAAKKFDGHELSPGKTLKVNISIANTRLFLGNIPKTKSKDEILEELKTHAEGVTDVIVYSVPDNEKIRNRGFCFVDFIDHKTASDIKRKIAQHKIRPFNADVYVDWAEHQDEPDADTMSKVKVLYIRNIKEAITEEKLTELFKEYASLDRVKKVKDYAFIHFNERDDCVKAMEEWNGKDLEGTIVEASLAKPPQEKKKKPSMRGRGNNYGGGNDRGHHGGRGGGNWNRGGGNQYNQQGQYFQNHFNNGGYDMPMPWGGGGYGNDMGYGGYGGGYGGPGAYGDFGGGYGGYGGPGQGGFRGGARGSPRGGGGFRGGPQSGGRGGMANRRGRGKRPGDGRGGPASKRDNGKPDFSADVNMSTF